MNTFRVTTQVEIPDVPLTVIAEQLALMSDTVQGEFFNLFVGHLCRHCASDLAVSSQMLAIGQYLGDRTRRDLAIMIGEVTA